MRLTELSHLPSDRGPELLIQAAANLLKPRCVWPIEAVKL
jgi:hypothetical protein